MQGRFRHLLNDDETLAELQSWVDANWDRLRVRAQT
jgi:ribosome assembly protein YihI (activator of Der GTPase)